MKTIKIIARYEKERAQLVLALASLGYKSWVVDVPELNGDQYYVFFEIDDEFVLEKK